MGSGIWRQEVLVSSPTVLRWERETKQSPVLSQRFFRRGEAPGAPVRPTTEEPAPGPATTRATSTSYLIHALMVGLPQAWVGQGQARWKPHRCLRGKASS